MILSMTGYGKAETIVNEKKIHVEIKSLNSKNIDITTHIASLFLSKELEIRSYLTQRLIRGKIDFYLWSEDINTTQNTTFNETFIHSYIEQINKISAKENIPTPKDNWWEILSKLPNIVQQPTVTEVTDDLWLPVMETIKNAVDHLIEFRQQEGRAAERVALMILLEDLQRSLATEVFVLPGDGHLVAVDTKKIIREKNSVLFHRRWDVKSTPSEAKAIKPTCKTSWLK